METICDPRYTYNDSVAACLAGVNFDALFENMSHYDVFCCRFAGPFVFYVRVDAIATQRRRIPSNWSGIVTVERPFAARGGHPPRGRFGSTFESAAILNDRSDTFSWVHMLLAAREMINTPRTA